jgi:hypothetical protein
MDGRRNTRTKPNVAGRATLHGGTLVSILALLVGLSMAWAQPTEGDVELTWMDSSELTTNAFVVLGPWELTLTAWCHEGTSHVRIDVLDEDGVSVADVTVLGQGVRTFTMETEPGTYTLLVTSPTMEDYTWMISAVGELEDLGEQVEGGGSGEASSDHEHGEKGSDESSSDTDSR